MGGQAFSGKRLNGFFMDPNELVLIGLDTEDGPEHPLYDPRVLDETDELLARDIIANGIIQPITVRKNGAYAEVVAGRQRVKAARRANEILEEQAAEPVLVPFLVKRAEDADLLGVSISENEHRRDDDVITKATKAERLLELGKTEQEVAARFGVTDRTVRNWVTLLDTSAKVRKAVVAGKISATAASKLAVLPRAEQDAKLGDLLAKAEQSGKRPTVAATRNTARGKTTSAPRKKDVRKVWQLGADLSTETRNVLGWVLGESDPPEAIADVLAVEDAE